MATAAPGTVLNEQQEIVILAVTAQQAEVIRYAPDDGQPAADAVAGPPLHGRLHRSGHGRARAARCIAETTGITLQELIDTCGVLPPTIATPVLPTLAP